MKRYFVKCFDLIKISAKFLSCCFVAFMGVQFLKFLIYENFIVSYDGSGKMPVFPRVFNVPFLSAMFVVAVLCLIYMLPRLIRKVNVLEYTVMILMPFGLIALYGAIYYLLFLFI
ncbi:MAG: hypothetical protein J6X42_04710 [Alphaproteobacteria bacterium]|nr:hypothetical protein [Alphaproteobacteria bacterium]